MKNKSKGTYAEILAESRAGKKSKHRRCIWGNRQINKGNGR